MKKVTTGQPRSSAEPALMKKVRFGKLPVGTVFLFRGQRFKKLDTSLAGDSKSSQILFDRGTEVEPIGNEKTPISADSPPNRPTHI
jgi:hypothetical protein